MTLVPKKPEDLFWTQTEAPLNETLLLRDYGKRVHPSLYPKEFTKGNKFVANAAEVARTAVKLEQFNNLEQFITQPRSEPTSADQLPTIEWPEEGGITLKETPPVEPSAAVCPKFNPTAVYCQLCKMYNMKSLNRCGDITHACPALGLLRKQDIGYQLQQDIIDYRQTETAVLKVKVADKVISQRVSFDYFGNIVWEELPHFKLALGTAGERRYELLATHITAALAINAKLEFDNKRRVTYFCNLIPRLALILAPAQFQRLLGNYLLSYSGSGKITRKYS